MHKRVPTVPFHCAHFKGLRGFPFQLFLRCLRLCLEQETNKGSVVPAPGAALETQEEGYRELAAGSYRTLFFLKQRKNHSSHPAWSLVLRGTSGRPQEGK